MQPFQFQRLPMDNALKNTRNLNFSRKTDTPQVNIKMNSSNNSPQIRAKGQKVHMQQEPMGVEQRVHWWFCQRGVKRGDPSSLFDCYKEIRLKRISSQRQNMKPSDFQPDENNQKQDNSLINRRLKRRLTVQL